MNRDLIRVLLVVVPHVLLFFATTAVLASYLRAFRLDKKISHALGRPVYGLLPQHVTAVTLMTMLFSATLVADTFARLGTPLTWRVISYSLSGWIGLYGLIQVLRFERLRYTHVDDPTG